MKQKPSLIERLEKEEKNYQRIISDIETKIQRTEEQIEKVYITTRDKVAEETLKKIGLYDRIENKEEGIEEELLDKLKELPLEERLLTAEYLDSKSVIIGGCGSFGYFKEPSTCSSCVQGRTTLSRLELKGLAKYIGDRQYVIPKEEFLKAAEKYGVKEEMERLERELENYKANLETLKKKRIRTKKLIRAYKFLGDNHEEVASKYPDFVEWLITLEQGRDNITFAKFDLEKRVGVAIVDTWNYYGSGGCEYGNYVKVWRDGKTFSKYYKYRDPYDAKKDAWHLRFGAVEIKEVTDSNVVIELISDRTQYKLEEVVELPRNKNYRPKNINFNLTMDLENKLERIDEELLKRHTHEHAMMPAYILYRFKQGVMPTSGEETIPYLKPEIIDKYIDPESKKAAVIIKEQIDHDAGFGIQFRWVGYVIEGLDTEKPKIREVWSDNAYELHLIKGKRIEKKARDLLGKE